MRLWHSQVPIRSCYGYRTTSVPSTPVFHVLMLEPATPNMIPDQVQSPPPPVFIDGKLEFEIAKILDSKVDQRRHNCKLLYLIRWTGYAGTDEETS